MKRKGPTGPKPGRVNGAPRDRAQEIALADRIAGMILMRLRAEAPQLFTVTTPTPSA